MLLDHFNAFEDFQPADLLLDFPMAKPARIERPRRSVRPRTGGFLPGTMVDTDRGFMEVRDLKPGDMVYTFDGGAQEVKAVKHSVPRLTTLMHVPAGALGNDTDLLLPSDQMVALELDEAAMRAAPVFEYGGRSRESPEHFYSYGGGDADRLPGGDAVLFVSGWQFPTLIGEVSYPEGQERWRYECQDVGEGQYRVNYFPSLYETAP